MKIRPTTTLRIGIPIALAALAMLAGCAGMRSEELDPDRGWTWAHNNLHQIEGPDSLPAPPTPAFRLYRSGVPSRKTFEQWCSQYDIQRVIVLSGDAKSHEREYQADGLCPEIEVLYDIKQTYSDPVTDGFLTYLDAEIERARADGVGLLFRCQTGSHRTGRAAAWVQMKYQGIPVDEAIDTMTHKGVLMWALNPKLIPQVRAMDDYLHGRECSQPPKACVEIDSDRWVP